jgi:hypothetical protein
MDDEGVVTYFFPQGFPKDLRHLILEWSLYAFLRETDNSVFSCFCVVQMYERFLAKHFPKVSNEVLWLFSKRSKLRWVMFSNVDYFKATQAIVQFAFGYEYDKKYYSMVDVYLKDLKAARVGFPLTNCPFAGSYYFRVFNFSMMRYQVVWFEDEGPKALKNIVPLKELLEYIEKK